MTEIWAVPALWPSLALVATLLSIRLSARNVLAEIVVIVMAQRPLAAIVATSVSGFRGKRGCTRPSACC